MLYLLSVICGILGGLFAYAICSFVEYKATKVKFKDRVVYTRQEQERIDRLEVLYEWKKRLIDDWK